MVPFTIAFLAIIIFIITKPKRFSEGEVALFGLLVLFVLTMVSWNDIPAALVGNDLFRPFEVVLILITLALLSTTLDSNGFFKHAAHKAILWSKNDGRVLFRNFFVLTILLTTFTSNDVDVLTVTPIILWFASTTKINPLPFLFSVFVATNTSSMEFLFGNLTNIVVGNVFGIGFVEFFLVMIVPTVVTLLAQYYLLKFIFRKQLPKVLLTKKELANVETKLSQKLPNKNKNIFVLTVLGFVIVGSALSDFLPFDIWMITSLGALVVLLSGKFNLKKSLLALPWDVVVFVLVFIVLTFKLQEHGVVDLIGTYFSGTLSSVWSSLFVSSFFSAIASGVINNIPASISLSSVYYSLTIGADQIIKDAVAYGLVIGTNLGAIISPVGALATILWMSLIRKKGYSIPMGKFMGYGLLTGFVSIVIVGLVVGVELVLFK